MDQEKALRPCLECAEAFRPKRPQDDGTPREQRFCRPACKRRYWNNRRKMKP